jgi:hypothetical protein
MTQSLMRVLVVLLVFVATLVALILVWGALVGAMGPPEIVLTVGLALAVAYLTDRRIRRDAAVRSHEA